MSKKAIKILLSLILTVGVSVPALANQTSITILAEVDSVLSVRLERKADNVIVSGDDDDPGSFAEPANEILNFGTITPLGTRQPTANTTAIVDGVSTAAGQSDNGTAGTIAIKTIDSSNVLYDPAANTAAGQPANGAHAGAIYTIRNSLQVRALKNGTGNIIVKAAASGGGLSAIIAADTVASGTQLGTVQTYGVSDTLDATTNEYAQAAAEKEIAGLVTGIPSDTAFPISVGLHVPFSKVAGATTTIVTFTASTP